MPKTPPVDRPIVCHPDHIDGGSAWRRSLSRGQVLGIVAGAMVTAVSMPVWPSRSAKASAGILPNPIPGGVAQMGVTVHQYPLSIGAEPSLITDFSGTVAAATFVGNGVGTDTTSGASTRLTFLAELRLMNGLYVGVDQVRHFSSFGYFSLELYPGQAGVGPQAHAFTPGIASNSLFWTAPLNASAVGLNPDQGTASLKVVNLGLQDYRTRQNALLGGPSTAAIVSADMEVTGQPFSTGVCDSDNDFLGQFYPAAATLVWSATTAGFSFVADPASAAANAALIGRESNGAFFRAAGGCNSRALTRYDVKHIVGK